MFKNERKSVSIDLVKPNDYNPKLNYNDTPQGQAMFEKLKKSIQLLGQVDDLKVRELDGGTYELVNGFHRLTAMIELGIKKVDILNYGKIKREEAIALALSTEEIRFDLDELEVAKLVNSLKELEFNFDLLPYTAEELELKLKMIDFNWEQFDDVEAEGKEKKEITCPKCGHKFIK